MRWLVVGDLGSIEPWGGVQSVSRGLANSLDLFDPRGSRDRHWDLLDLLLPGNYSGLLILGGSGFSGRSIRAVMTWVRRIGYVVRQESGESLSETLWLARFASQVCIGEASLHESLEPELSPKLTLVENSRDFEDWLRVLAVPLEDT